MLFQPQLVPAVLRLSRGEPGMFANVPAKEIDKIRSGKGAPTLIVGEAMMLERIYASMVFAACTVVFANKDDGFEVMFM